MKNRIRFVFRTDGLVTVTLLDRPTFVSFVVQAPFFRRVTAIQRKSFGTASVTDAQLVTLGVVPHKEVIANDARTAIAAM